MQHNINLKTYLHLSVITILAICLTLPFSASTNPSSGSPDYTYYGVVPAKIYRYILNDWNAPISWNNLSLGWSIATSAARYLGGSLALNDLQVATHSLLAIVAGEDGTHVKVYDLADGSLLSEADIDNMEKHLVLLANGTQFKVVSNKIVSVLILNYQEFPSATATDGPIPRTFYTDVNGLYVGKKFVLMASELPGAVSGAASSQVGQFYAVFALEKASVTVTKDDGTTLTSFTLDANSYKFITLDSFRVYTIESSTGNIMVQSGTITGKGNADSPCFVVPSANGGFVGTAFYARSLKSQEWTWDPGRDYGFRITASGDTTVQVWNLETKQLIKKLIITAGSGTSIQTEAFAIAVLSDKPITVMELHNGSIEQSPTGGGGKYASYGQGVMFICLQPNEDITLSLPTNAHVEAYFFTSEDTQLTIDGDAQTIHANTPFLYTGLGVHTFRSDKNVILQINCWPFEPEYQGLWYNGAAIPCIETVNNNPTVTLTPLGEAFPMTYIIAGGGAAAAVIVIVLVMKRRGSKPS